MLVILLLIGICSFLGIYLHRALLSETDTQMEAEIETYCSRLRKQISRDFQMLHTLRSIIEEEGIQNKEEFSHVLERANKENDFISMMYFPKNGQGTVVSTVEGTRHSVKLAEMQKECRTVIKAALGGESSLSQPFYSEFSDQVEFVYAVPVYENGTVAGALAGSNTIGIFSEILSVYGVMGGNGFVHMLNKAGDFLIVSDYAVVKNETDNVFTGSYFQTEDMYAAKEAMQKEEPYIFSFLDQGKNYRALLYPVGYNDWYLFCISAYRNMHNAMYRVVNMILIIFTVVMVLVIVLLFFGFRMLRKSYRDLFYTAYRDRLSGAYNRQGFFHEAEELVKAGKKFSLAGINVRQFKYINEMFGQEKADDLLRFIAKKTDSYLREGEIICRDSADNFYLLLLETEKLLILERLRHIKAVIEEESVHAGSTYCLRLYCGCVIADEELKRDINKMMTHLIFTLSDAKKNVDSDICFYDNKLYDKMQIENYIESHMQLALDSGEFQMFLQPKISLQDRSLAGAEALVRWIMKDGGRIFPDQFIPQFEKNGFCAKLDLYMVECACKKIRQWMDEGKEPVGISVNQTKLLFFDADYIGQLRRLIAKYQVPAHLITLEILEGIAIENPEELNKIIDRLNAIGFRVAMDDFGSGYSSLNILAKLHLNELKIDRGFLQQLTTDKQKRASVVLEQVVHMTKRLKIDTVVEGVETKEQEDLLVYLGCDLAQGYYYNKPLSVSEFEAFYMS